MIIVIYDIDYHGYNYTMEHDEMIRNLVSYELMLVTNWIISCLITKC